MSLAIALPELIAGLVAPPICWACSGLARQGEPLCGGCRASLHRLAAEPVSLSSVRVWAPVAYSGPARDLVRALKFRGAMGVADAMAAQIVANAPAGLVDVATAPGVPPARRTAVPVPLHPKRLRSRGYNQAAVIAEAVARRAGLELGDCLSRSGPSVTQMGRDRAERMAGPVGSVELCGAAPARVLLVDDVVTTGSTLAACRAALVAAGAEEVVAVVFARTIGR
jgi:ComF family protein